MVYGWQNKMPYLSLVIYWAWLSKALALLENWFQTKDIRIYYKIVAVICDLVQYKPW